MHRFHQNQVEVLMQHTTNAAATNVSLPIPAATSQRRRTAKIDHSPRCQTLQQLAKYLDWPHIDLEPAHSEWPEVSAADHSHPTQPRQVQTLLVGLEVLLLPMDRSKPRDLPDLRPQDHSAVAEGQVPSCRTREQAA